MTTRAVHLWLLLAVALFWFAVAIGIRAAL